jgi:hypothetical protein
LSWERAAAAIERLQAFGPHVVVVSDDAAVKHLGEAARKGRTP